MWINAIASIGVFSIGAFILLQIWVASGGKQVGILGKKCFTPMEKVNEEKISKKEIVQVAFGAIVFRIAIYLISICLSQSGKQCCPQTFCTSLCRCAQSKK